MKFHHIKDTLMNVVLDSRFTAVTIALGIWITLCILIGSDYPFNYDSINYALSITDDFDVGKCQPHAWGYIYHIIICRLWLPIVDNPFRIQQFQSIVYLFTAILFMLSTDKKKGWAVLIPATVPVSLFFASTAVIHAALFAASAAIAWTILRLEEKKEHPLIITIVFAICTGFRQDLAIFMGPVVLFALIRRKCSIRLWTAVFIIGGFLTALWYLGTSWSSGWLSPYKEAIAIQKPFLQGTSLVYGAPVRVWLWMVLRMIVYIPAVIGPGGILLLIIALRSVNRFDRIYLSMATAPFFIYATVIYAGMANYYAAITGFVFTWVLKRNRQRYSVILIITAVLLNVIYFIIAPEPLHKNKNENHQSFQILQASIRLLSWSGATSMAAVMKNRGFENFLDKNIAGCNSFSANGQIEYNGIPYWRIWNIMGKRVWHNIYNPNFDSTECMIGIVKEGDHPDCQYDNIGVWYSGTTKN